MIGETIGPFRVLRKLGAGGMGEVFLAEDNRLGRLVALKSPSASWLESPDARARLQREARAAARLNDSRIAAVYDVLDVDGRPFIVMEWVEGETLTSALKRGAFSPERALAVGSEIADALIAAHAAGIIHRDLKPANVMLTAGDRAKILDFGVAKMTDAGDVLTSTGEALGTPGYTAPEQLLGKADARSDIYSTGALLYELLTGKPPIHDGPDRGVAALLEPVTDIRTVTPSVPREVADVVMRALEREPRDRYQSAKELAEAIARARGALSEMPTRANVTAIGGTPRAARWATVAIVVLLLAAVGVPLARRWSGPPPKAASTRTPVVAVLPFSDFSADKKLEYMGDGIADTVGTKLSAIAGLSVISRGEIHDAVKANKTIANVCRALGATYVVTGGIQQNGERIQVTVNLLSPDGSTIRSGLAYEDSVENLFALERQIAESLTEQIAGSVSSADLAQLAEGETKSIPAMAAYWRGRHLLEQPGPDPIDPAIAAFGDAVNADPTFALGWAGLGSAYWRKYVQTKDHEASDQAVKAATRAQHLDPSSTDVQITLATIYKGTGDTAEAIKQLTHALHLHPNNYQALRLMADIDAARGQAQQAIDEYQKAIAIRPDYWETYRSLGALYWHASRYQEAIDAFTRITELQPDSPIGWQTRGTVYATMMKLDEARSDLEKALAHGGSAGTYSVLGTVSYYQGRFADAAHDYEQAIQLRAKNALTHYNLGDAYRQLGRSAEASRAYQDGRDLADADLEVNPKDAEALAIRGTCQARLGHVDSGLADLQHAAEIAPQDQEVQYHRALVLTLAGRTDAAVDAASQAVADGYSTALLRTDDDLKPLRGSAAFQALLEEHGAESGRRK